MRGKRKIIIAAGGSGGHLYPAMETASKLLKHDSNVRVLFAAGGLESNRFFDHTAFDLHTIDAAPPTRKAPWETVKNCGRIAKGIWQSHRLLASFKPDLVLGFGSYHSFPVLFAASLRRYPILLHEQNSKPGKVIRFFSKRALMTGGYFPSAGDTLKGKFTLLSMPLREGFSYDVCSKIEACDYYGIDSNRCTVLVFGGSQGARFINRTVPELLCKSGSFELQVLHFTGVEEDVEKVKTMYRGVGIKAIVKSSEKRMDYAWKAATMAIVRAGAGTIAEQIEFEVPAIFVPYPYAADNHQDSNADYIVDHVGGGWKWSENNDTSLLLSLLRRLLTQESFRLEEKRRNLSLYKKKIPSLTLHDEILKILF